MQGYKCASNFIMYIRNKKSRVRETMNEYNIIIDLKCGGCVHNNGWREFNDRTWTAHLGFIFLNDV